MSDKLRSQENTLHDLETHVHRVWQTSTDIIDLYHATEGMSEDNIQNAMLGIHQLHEIRMENLSRVLAQNIAREFGTK